MIDTLKVDIKLWGYLDWQRFLLKKLKWTNVGQLMFDMRQVFALKTQQKSVTEY